MNSRKEQNSEKLFGKVKKRTKIAVKADVGQQGNLMATCTGTFLCCRTDWVAIIVSLPLLCVLDDSHRYHRHRSNLVAGIRVVVHTEHS